MGACTKHPRCGWRSGQGGQTDGWLRSPELRPRSGRVREQERRRDPRMVARDPYPERPGRTVQCSGAGSITASPSRPAGSDSVPGTSNAGALHAETRDLSTGAIHDDDAQETGVEPWPRTPDKRVVDGVRVVRHQHDQRRRVLVTHLIADHQPRGRRGCAQHLVDDGFQHRPKLGVAIVRSAAPPRRRLPEKTCSETGRPLISAMSILRSSPAVNASSSAVRHDRSVTGSLQLIRRREALRSSRQFMSN